MEIGSIIISVLALAGSIYSIVISKKYSQISVTHSLQELILQKAKDCNALFSGLESENQISHPGLFVYRIAPTLSEIIISIQLLDNSLSEYDQKNKRSFFLLQFWIQLTPPLRFYFKSVNPNQFYSDTAKGQIDTIVKTFSQHFPDY